MEKNIVNIGIDLGNFYTKTSNENKFESRLRLCNDKVFELLSSGNVIVYQNRKYLLESGSFDVINNKSDKTSENIIVNLCAALSIDVPNGSSVRLAVGLPIDEYSIRQDEFKKMILDNPINFSKGGNNYSYEIESLHVMPECMGVYYSLDEATLKELIGKSIIIIDIGGKTTDICYIEYYNNRRRVVDHLTLKVGTIDIYKRIAKKINIEYGLNIKKEEVHNVIVNNAYVGDIDMSFVDSIYDEVAYEIFNSIQGEYDYKIAHTIVAGGGSSLIFDNIKKYIDKNISCNKDFYANAKGFKKYLERVKTNA